MLTFMVPPDEPPSTRAARRHLASSPCEDLASNRTKLQIRQQERSYSRHLKILKEILTSIHFTARYAYISITLTVKTSRPQFVIKWILRQRYNIFFICKNSTKFLIKYQAKLYRTFNTKQEEINYFKTLINNFNIFINIENQLFIKLLITY